MPRNLLRQDGVWHYRFEHGRKSYRGSLFTNDIDVARQRLIGRRDEVIARAFGQNPARTFNDAVVRWRLEHWPTLRPNTQRTYATALRCLVLTYGTSQIAHINSARLSDYKTRRLGDGVARSTIRHEIAVLAAVLDHCTHWGWVGGNVATAFLKARGRKDLAPPPPRRRVLDEEEERLILRHATDEARPGLTLYIDAALRRNELLKLKWSDVDLALNQITIRAENAKSGNERVIPLLPRGRKVLETLKAASEANGQLSPYVFIGRHGRRYAEGSKVYNEALAAAARIAGAALGRPVKNLRLHDLRRTGGSRLLTRHGWTIPECSRFLGHASINTTEKIYLVTGAEFVHAAMRRTLDAQRSQSANANQST